MRGFFCFLLCFMLLGISSLALAQSNLPPLGKGDIIGELRDGNSSRYIVNEVNYRGIDFTLTPEIEQQLHKAGADKDLMNAIRKARVVSAAPPLQSPGSTTGSSSTSASASGSPVLL